MQRREVIGSLAAVAAAAALPAVEAELVTGGPPSRPGAGALPDVAHGTFLDPAELAMVEVIADRFIPPDAMSVGGKDAGCAVFIDRQLAGDYGRGATMYRLGRFVKGTEEQGTQSALTPAERWRQGLAAIDKFCSARYGKPFVQIGGEAQDAMLAAMEHGKVDLGAEVEVKPLFEQMLQNVREGFLADPIYGGNRAMASWKMIGFPGAQYDFRDLLDKKGQKLAIIPISLVDDLAARSA